MHGTRPHRGARNPIRAHRSMADHPNPSRYPLVDSHAHLDSEDFVGEVREIVARAEDYGLVSIVTIGPSVSRA